MVRLLHQIRMQTTCPIFLYAANWCNVKESCKSSVQALKFICLEETPQGLDSSARQRCLHPVICKGACKICGEHIQDLTAIPLDYIHKGLKVSLVEMDALRLYEHHNLFHKEKLCLLLDLDNTLLHTVQETELSSLENYLLNQTDSSGSVFRWKKSVTKLRPYVQTFLRKASNMFDMYIYTKGARRYALSVVELFDPEWKYFKDKVISLEDSTTQKLKGLDVVLAPESVVVILDDRKDVWRRHAKNLIVIEKYLYFAGVPRHTPTGGMSLCESNVDESEDNGALAKILVQLECVYAMFFTPEEGVDPMSRDVRPVLRELLDASKIW